MATVSASFNGTYVHKYKVDNGLTEEYDCAGLLWSGVQRLDRCQLGTDPEVAAQGAHRHADCRSASDCRFNGATLVRSVRKRLEDNETLHGDFNFEPTLHVKAQNYFDLAATYTLLDRVNLRAGVNNLFDNDPPLITTGSGSREGSNICPTGPCNGNTYPGTWDALGRLFWAGVTIDFTPSRVGAAATAAPAAAAASACAATCDANLRGWIGDPGDRCVPGAAAAAAAAGTGTRAGLGRTVAELLGGGSSDPPPISLPRVPSA